MVGFLKPIKIGQKLVEYAKIQKFKYDIFGNFHTMCIVGTPLLPKIYGFQ